MTAFELQKQVRQTGSYATPPSHRGMRLPSILASPLFHLRLLVIFLRGHAAARAPDFEMKEWVTFCYRMLRLTEALGGDVAVSGFEHASKAGFPVVWVSNHMSPLETYLLPLVLTSYTRLMVILKDSLAHYPVFGRIVRAVHPIRVRRQSPLEDLRKVLTEGARGLEEGRSVLVFPQGQRFSVFDPVTFNSMGVKLARRTGVPMVPVAVRTDFLRLGRWHKDMVSVHADRPVRMACGCPISPELSPRAMQDAATEFIASKLSEWERETGSTQLLAPSATLP